MAMYEVLEGYWKDSPYVVLVTDDVWFARSELLRRLERRAGELTRQKFAEFETKFDQWISGKFRFRVQTGGDLCEMPLFFSVRDYRTELRVAQQTVAIGGMSTIQVGA